MEELSAVFQRVRRNETVEKGRICFILFLWQPGTTKIFLMRDLPEADKVLVPK
jgi:hypothetical protein